MDTEIEKLEKALRAAEEACGVTHKALTATTEAQIYCASWEKYLAVQQDLGATKESKDVENAREAVANAELTLEQARLNLDCALQILRSTPQHKATDAAYAENNVAYNNYLALPQHKDWREASKAYQNVLEALRALKKSKEEKDA